MEIPAITLYPPLISYLFNWTGSFLRVRTHAFHYICMSHTTYTFLFNRNVQGYGTPLVIKRVNGHSVLTLSQALL